MAPNTLHRLIEKYSTVLTALSLLAILLAGFWPFNPFPENGVEWLNSRNGIRFQGRGIVVGNTPRYTHDADGQGCSFEIWFQPADNGGLSPILDFYRVAPPKQFSILQDGNSELLLTKSGQYPYEMKLAINFRPGEQKLLTVASNAQGTTVYLDGIVAAASAGFGVVSADCNGSIVLGGAAESSFYWNGDIFGIAIFNENLTDDQVLRHYELWKKDGSLQPDETEKLSALYLFDERKGMVVHSKIIGSSDLYIPKRYQIPYRHFLKTEWTSTDWKDISVNIAGFVPLGFFLFSIFRTRKQKKWAAFTAILIGALTSSTIETLQWYLPGRDSSLADVITNTIGTGLGVTICRYLSATFDAAR